MKIKVNNLKGVIFLLTILCVFKQSFTANAQRKLNSEFDVNKALNYCVQHANNTLLVCPADSVFPRTILKGSKQWSFIPVEDWTSGFWPGILWNLYDYTKDTKWKNAAAKYTEYLNRLSQRKATDHDLGFQIFCSFGNGYRLTKDQAYKQTILRTADTLATLYNPKVGTLLSWPMRVKALGGHNTIIDNMMNLELLLWSAKNGKNKSLKNMAMRHADVTMKNHFRKDYSSYHVIVYDANGNKIRGVTFQGQADESMWARGQAWAIYGYVTMYKETRQLKYLHFAINLSNLYLKKLPQDFIPYWDFDAPNIPDETRDASAAAITASALLDLSKFVKQKQAAQYKNAAEKMLIELSSDRYQSREKNSAFLLRSRGSKTHEIDVSINYADYYYLEALLKLKRYK